MKKLGIGTAVLILCFILAAKDLSAQEWSGLRANAEPGINWIFGTSNHIGDIWRYRENITVGTSTLYEYGSSYQAISPTNRANLSWRFEILKRNSGSSHAFGLRASFLSSSASARAEAVTPTLNDVFYIESCRMFGQALLPLINTDEPSGFSRAHCGGESYVRVTDLNIFIEEALHETSEFSLYGTFGVGYRRYMNTRHDWERQTAIMEDYFFEGDFYNEVSLDARSRSRAELGMLTLGLRANLNLGRVSLDFSLDQSLGFGMLGIDSTTWTDVDDIYIRTPDGSLESITYLDGKFPLSPISEMGVIFGNSLGVRANYRLNRDLTLGINLSCTRLGSMFKPAQWEVPADWGILQGTGWKSGLRENPTACGISSRFTVIL